MNKSIGIKGTGLDLLHTGCGKGQIVLIGIFDESSDMGFNTGIPGQEDGIGLDCSVI